MSDSSSLVQNQKFLLRAFWIMLAATIAFHIGAEASKGHYVCDIYRAWQAPDGLSMFFVFSTLIVLIIILINFFTMGKRSKPTPASVLEQIEKLGKLREQGHITLEEFEREKKKLWEHK